MSVNYDLKIVLKLSLSRKKLKYFSKGCSFSSFLGFSMLLTLFRMGIFGAAHGHRHPPLPKICHTYPTMMKLGTVTSYLKSM